MRKSTYRKRAKKTFFKFLEGQRGGFVQITALLLELSQNNDIYVTRSTVTNWLKEFGCEWISNGVYKVPKVDSPTTEPMEEPEAISQQ